MRGAIEITGSPQIRAVEEVTIPTNKGAVSVSFEDGEGRGRVVLSFYDKVWAANWFARSRGPYTIQEFFARIDSGYAANKMDGDGWYDAHATEEACKKWVIEHRRADDLDDLEARILYDVAKNLHCYRTDAYASWIEQAAKSLEDAARDEWEGLYALKVEIDDPAFVEAFGVAQDTVKAMIPTRPGWATAKELIGTCPTCKHPYRADPEEVDRLLALQGLQRRDPRKLAAYQPSRASDSLTAETVHTHYRVQLNHGDHPCDMGFAVEPLEKR